MADPQDRPDDASAPPAKKTPEKKAVKEPAKKVPAKKVPAKKAPAKSPAPAPPKLTEASPGPQQRIETNGQLASAAKDTAAQAKSAVDDANDPVPSAASTPEPGHSPVPLAIAVGLSLLALLLVRQLRRR